MPDALSRRFAATAELVAERQEPRLASTRSRLARLLAPVGTERALDVGTGAGAMAIALSGLVSRIVGVDLVPELLAQARLRSPGGIEYLEADATALPFEASSFDVVCTARTLHHVSQPERVVAEMDRVLRAGGAMLVVDQIAPDEPAAAEALNRFERARDPSTSRVLSEADLRGLLARGDLELISLEVDREERELEAYLDLAACGGPERERASALAPRDLSARVAWCLLRKRASR